MADLWIEEWKRCDGIIELGARFESQTTRKHLWYRVEAQRESELTLHADAFVMGILQIAMHAGEDLQVHGTVSPSLLRNLEDFQRAWAVWKPEYYRSITVRADVEKEFSEPGRHEAICCFSGGVDSSFTAYRHARGQSTRFPYPLRTAVLVQGFDIPLKDTAYYESACAKVTRQLDSLGIGLYRVATNFKELSIFWPHAFGTGVASVLSLFQRRYGLGLIAQGVPYSSYQNLVEGSNPLTDPLLSSAAFQIVPDGSGFQRWEKIQAISGWPEGMEHLRVCWEGEKKDSNCCDCEKCIRNILTFRALGLPLPKAFPTDPTDERIYRLGPLKEFTIGIGYNSLLNIAQKNGLGNAGWIKSLKKAIFRSRAIRKLSKNASGRLLLWMVRCFLPAWRQPVEIIKF
ncbi:MAG: hypothetical protein MUP71_12645 [Candidatus Aminicenantes bacterium]|nr:hypothetical protein [Candidatus Aminicenantes bacterium]